MGELSLAVVGSDYSRDTVRASTWCPHDLAWLLIDQVESCIDANWPAWAAMAVRGGQPVVVRRARRGGATLPVGIRGARRDQRFAVDLPVECLQERVSPEALTTSLSPLDPWRASLIPALAALDEAAAIMHDSPYVWGIGGAVGFEIASEIPAAHVDSDLDILLCVAERPEPVALQRIAGALAHLPMACDVQMETPAGGVALADWLGPSAEVLVKTDQGPYLAIDPWAVPAPAHG